MNEGFMLQSKQTIWHYTHSLIILLNFIPASFDWTMVTILHISWQRNIYKLDSRAAQLIGIKSQRRLIAIRQKHLSQSALF